MRREEIEEIRNILVEELEKYEGEPILLPLEPKLLNEIIFEDYYGDGFKRFYYKFKSFNLLKKIDFSNIPFTNVILRECDLTNLKNVRIDPQIVYNKDLSYQSYNGVEFIGTFDNAICSNANFTGSVGTVINPQTIKDKKLSHSILKDATFNGGFDGVDIINSDFTGSKGAIIKGCGTDFTYTKLCDATILGEIKKSKLHYTDFTGAKSINSDLIKLNPRKILYKSMIGCIFNGIIFTREFDYCKIFNCDFTGSKNAVINPINIHNNLEGCTFNGVHFTDSLDYISIVGCDFTGSIGTVINPQKVINKNLSSTNFCDVVFDGPFDNTKIKGSNFTGSVNAVINPQTIQKNLSYTNLTDAIVVDNFNDVFLFNTTMTQDANLIDDDNMNEKEECIKKMKSLFK